jgi:hypothetical protein
MARALGTFCRTAGTSSTRPPTDRLAAQPGRSGEDNFSVRRDLLMLLFARR